jgi:predicted kinase
MQRGKLAKQLVVMLYGYPGSGKSFFSRQIGEFMGMPVISSDRIRYELFDKPTFSKDEQQVVMNLMNIMLEDYLKAGLSVVYDISLNRTADRKFVREFAKRNGASSILLWLQADIDSCFLRAKARDRRKADDKYSAEMTEEIMRSIEAQMQSPSGEDAVVVSGKHLFDAQRNVFLRKLREMQLIAADQTSAGGVAKPELVNLVSAAQMHAGRVDQNRRNLIIS